MPAARALGCGGCTSSGCVDAVCARSPRAAVAKAGPRFWEGAGGGGLHYLAGSSESPSRPQHGECGVYVPKKPGPDLESEGRGKGGLW
jgi:hypothetical protein